MTPAASTLLAQLDTTLAQAPGQWRSTALRQIVDLFVAGSEGFSDDHVAVFDEVMCRLMKNNVDRPLLVELSNKLAPLANAPAKVVSTLARHSDIAIHGPVLEQGRVPDKEIVAIIDRDRVDPKLLKRIANRRYISQAVTDVLLKRGNASIQRTIIDNPNALISESGFARLVIGVNGDKRLATAIAARKDLPAELRVWLDKTLNG